MRGWPVRSRAQAERSSTLDGMRVSSQYRPVLGLLTFGRQRIAQAAPRCSLDDDVTALVEDAFKSEYLARNLHGVIIMKYLNYRLMVMMLVILVIGALGYLAREVGSMEWLIENEVRMRTFVHAYPRQAWLLGLGVYTAFSLVPGTTGKSVIW